jgi:hypothetical protein
VLRLKRALRRLALPLKGWFERLCFCTKTTFPGAGFGKSAPRKVPDLSKGLPEIEPFFAECVF